MINRICVDLRHRHLRIVATAISALPMERHIYIKADEAFAAADEYSACGKPFFIAVDFEMQRALFYPADSIPETIHIECGAFSCHSLEAQADTPELSATPQPFGVYKQGFEYIQRQIQAGDSYLVNYTVATDITSTASLAQIYAAASARFKLLVDGEFAVFSPEPFISITGQTISAFPMKGTIDASIPNAEATILRDVKEKAEHATIVDLLRNDLSKVSNQVTVNRYRYVETIKTSQTQLLQVSSEITGTLLPHYKRRIGSILAGLLPAGSVSGAPKKKTLEIIKTVEQESRGFYCGIMGIFDGHNFSSGVLIRYIESTATGLKYRSGGGITHQSTAESEYKELIDKIYVPTP